jgi:tetratricopeptide (TPR) repeat protein
MLTNIKTIDEILALISYRLRVTQNMSAKLNITKEIETTLASFAGDQGIFKSVQFKIKFYKTISQILVQQKKYNELERYLALTYKDFSEAGIFNKQTHDIKTEQLVYWGNALLMQRKYDEAIEKSKAIEEALNEYNGILHDKYIYFVYQLQINAYAAIDLDKAADLLQKVVSLKNLILEPYHLLINYANLTFIYFIQKKFKLVVKTLQNIYRNEFFENTDMHLKAQLAILEILTRYELEEPDNFEYRLRHIERSFKTDWQQYDGLDKVLLTMVKLMFYSPGFKRNVGLKKMASDYLRENNDNQNRIFNYDDWVIEKFGKV